MKMFVRQWKMIHVKKVENKLEITWNTGMDFQFLILVQKIIEERNRILKTKNKLLEEINNEQETNTRNNRE